MDRETSGQTEDARHVGKRTRIIVTEKKHGESYTGDREESIANLRLPGIKSRKKDSLGKKKFYSD